MPKAIFLDRDGTLNVDFEYISDPGQIQLLESVSEALRILRERDYILFLVTNQSGIHRGYLTWEQLEQCQKRLLELIGLGPDLFLEVCVAPEMPDEPSRYRKPSPRFMLEMIEKYSLSPYDCYMIGDKEADILSGMNAGIQSVWVETGQAITQGIERYIIEGTCIRAHSLLDFVRQRLE
jgi:D-glycero-D-manno-heptose 1,7-bisphosphate phosphatase